MNNFNLEVLQIVYLNGWCWKLHFVICYLCFRKEKHEVKSDGDGVGGGLSQIFGSVFIFIK